VFDQKTYIGGDMDAYQAAKQNYRAARLAWRGPQARAPKISDFLNALGGQPAQPNPAQTNPALPPRPIQQPFQTPQLPQMQQGMVGSSYGVNNLFPALSGYELPRY
jgi:hypothetical protein